MIPALACALLLCACASPCATLAERLCGCDQSREQNRKACDLARDPAARRRAEALARQTGTDPAAVCRRALDAFRCRE